MSSISQSGRPLSGRSQSRRPQSATKSELSNLKQEIRSIARNIRKYTRDKVKVAIQSAESGEEVLVDPVPGFEHKLKELTSKYEQINDGTKYRPSDEEKVYDFCEALYAELGRRDREILYMNNYYHEQATMTYIEGMIQNRYETRDNILQSYLMRYNGLKAEYQINGVAVDLNPLKGLVCTATVTSSIKIENDDARTVKHMYEWVRATDIIHSPFDIVIKREYFWITDARPLYHWPEKLTDYEERALREAEEERKRKELEALQEQMRAMEEAKKKAAEAKAAQQQKQSAEDDDEDEEYEEGDDEYEEGEREVLADSDNADGTVEEK